MRHIRSLLAQPRIRPTRARDLRNRGRALHADAGLIGSLAPCLVRRG